MLQNARRQFCFALLVLASACRGGGGQSGERPLTYDGATTISRHILGEAIPAFERKSGTKFARVDQSGGGKGLERLLAGEVEIAGVARLLTADELARQPYFQIIGYDALVVVLHASNPVRGLSKAQLKAIFTGAIVNWKDVGGTNLPVVTCTEPLKSGRNTLAVFRSTVLDDAPYGASHEAPDPSDCLAFVAANPGAISFSSLAYTTPGVRAIPIDGIAATPATVIDSTYLLSRPLLLVTRAQPTGNVAAFMAFMLSPDGQAIVGKKFIPAR
jgi:phosphate transport system substrate-binding protein